MYSKDFSPATVWEAAKWAEARLEEAGVFLGHGTLSAFDEAVWMLFYVLALPVDTEETIFSEAMDAKAFSTLQTLVGERIQTRKPLAYLLGEAYFAGLRFEVNEQVLVPRSPFAELITTGFVPWVDMAEVNQVLDIGTGSGCMALALAYHAPHVKVLATDISEQALALAARNAYRLELADRVQFCRADVWAGVPAQRFDLIISNPPYVPESEWRDLPDEYHREPKMALVADHHGFAIVEKIMSQAADFLTDDGMLFVELGNTAEDFLAAHPEKPWISLHLDCDEGGILAISREGLLS